MAIGIQSLSAEQYHAADGVSKSMLDRLAITPAHLRAYLQEPRPEPTDAMRFGTILHRAILEPDTMSGAFAECPEKLDLRTKDGQAWKAAQGDKPILSYQEARTVHRCVDAVWKHPMAKRLLAGADYERCLFAEDSHGTLRKARLDALPMRGNVLPDLKTTQSAAPADFEKSIATYRYHVQAAYYVDICKLLGIEKSAFAFIAVEKAPPYAVAVYALDGTALSMGQMIYQRDLTVYRQCVESGHWPAYPEEITTIGLPAWAQKEAEQIAA